MLKKSSSSVPKTMFEDIKGGNTYILPSASFSIVAAYFLAKIFTDASPEVIASMAILIYCIVNNLLIIIYKKIGLKT